MSTALLCPTLDRSPDLTRTGDVDSVLQRFSADQPNLRAAGHQGPTAYTETLSFSSRMTSSTISRADHSLPQETIEQIIDIADFETLKACTLVHHDWLPRARNHLFSELSFPPVAFRRRETVEAMRRSGGPDFREAIHSVVMDMAHSPASSAVRHLKLHFPKTDSCLDLAFMQTSSFISQLPFKNLSTLEFVGGDLFRDDGQDALFSFLKESPALAELRLIDNHSRPPEFLQFCSRLASTQPQLRSMHLTRFAEPDVCDRPLALFYDSLPLLHNPASLQILTLAEIDNLDAGSFVVPLLETPNRFFDLTRLQVLETTFPPLSYDEQIFRICGPSVAKLVFRTMDNILMRGESFPFEECFRHLCKLVHLELHLVEPDQHVTAERQDNMMLLLEHGVPLLRQLEQLTIGFVEAPWRFRDSSPPYTSAEWALFGERVDFKLDQLRRTSNPSLKRITLDIPCSWKNVTEERIRKYFPKTNGRGVLEVFRTR
ncbi:hypothetical protein D9758_006299 [Tetrapyrgos nigripes]|uniref:F-box domain-containing protein n=1 Tax=Tetrapyrgos nigripes TaxID=182062 RepID=A0A8H5D8D2_9AGAR|nr:hypothetical protein D9758_006299 [Tetrapyrgos nigripes]